MNIQLSNKEFNYKEYTQNFIDSSDNEDLEAFINQDMEESIEIESEILSNLQREDVAKLVGYMKEVSKNVLK